MFSGLCGGFAKGSFRALEKPPSVAPSAVGTVAFLEGAALQRVTRGEVSDRSAGLPRFRGSCNPPIGAHARGTGG